MKMVAAPTMLDDEHEQAGRTFGQASARPMQ